MIRKFFAVIASLLSAFVGEFAYFDNEYRFKLIVPSGWKVNTHPAGYPALRVEASPLRVARNGKPEACIKVAAAKLRAGSLEQYYKNSAMMYASMWNIDHEISTTFKSFPAKDVLLKQCTGLNTTTIRKMFVQVRDCIIVISCSSTPELFERYKPLFDEALAQFSFEMIPPQTQHDQTYTLT